MASNTIDLKYLVNYDQLKAANAEILKTGSNAQKSASVFEQSFRKVELENKKALSSVNQRIAFSKRMEAQKAKEARVTQQAAEQEVKALERLRQKYDQGHVAMEVYSRELNDLGTALKRKIITTDQYTKELERLNTATKMGTVVSSEFGGVAGQMGRRMSRSGVMVQQAGYQIGDFIVQVQSGQNAMVAFGQQATQMAGTLTMMGGKMVAIGTALGIAIPLATAFGAAWMRTRKELDETTGSAKKLEDRIKGINEAVEKYFRNQKALSQGVTPEVFDLQEAKDKLAALREVRKAAFDLMKATGIDPVLEPRASGFEAYQKAMADERKAVRELNRLKLKEHQELSKEIRKVDRETLAGSIRAAEEARVENTQREIEAENERMRREHQAIQERSSQEHSHMIAIQSAHQKAQEANRKATYHNGQLAIQQAQMGAAKEESARMAVADKVHGHMMALQNAYAAQIKASMDLAPSQDYLDNYNSVLAYQQYGETRGDAPKTPVKHKTPRGGGGASQQDALAKLRDRIKLDTELLGKTKERQEVERAIANSKKTYGKDAVDQAVAELAAYNQIVEKRQELQGIYDTAQSSMEDGFMAMVEGTKSVEDAFKDMARAIIKDLYQVYVIKRMVGSVEGGTGIAGILGGIFGKASGGTVQANQPYLVGEKGPELIVPRNRGHVMNADLTAGAMGGGGTVVVNQSFNFQANGDDSVKKIIAQAAPSIANMAKQSVMDARRRGGAMKNTFG